VGAGFFFFSKCAIFKLDSKFSGRFSTVVSGSEFADAGCGSG